MMNFAGMVMVKLPVENVMEALNNPAVLQAVLPSCVEARRIGPGQFTAKLSRKIGPMPVTVEPQITVAPLQDGTSRLTVVAGNAFIGRVQTAMDLRLETIPDGTRLSWKGDVNATGLAGRMLAERRHRVGPMVRNFFLGFKKDAERTA